MKRAQSIGRPQPRALLPGTFSGPCSRLAAALLVGACVLPAHAADGDDADWQQLADRARQAAMQQMQAAEDLDDSHQREDAAREAESAAREAERTARIESLKALKDVNVAEIERQARQAQQLALNSLPMAALSPDTMSQHSHRHTADSDDNSGGSNDKQVNERHPLNPDGHVYVNDVSGTVVVNGWNRNEVLITGELGPGVDHLEVSGDPSSLRVVVKLPKHSHNAGESDLRLMVPSGAGVELETVSADASVQGTRGPVKISTVSGDVGIDVQSQQVAVQTVSGDMILRAPSSSTQANTVSGDVHLSGLQGKLTVETVSGNVSVKGGRFTELRLKSVSGDMGLDASFSPQAVVTGESLSGNITLHVPADVSGTAMVKSFSGEAQCDLPRSTSASSSRGSSDKKREFMFGDGKGVDLELSTFSGDVRIDRLSAGFSMPTPQTPPTPPTPPTRPTPPTPLTPPTPG